MRRLIFALLMFGSGLLQAQNFVPMKDVADFKSRMQAVTSSTQTISSEFEQRKHLDILSEDIVTLGKFYFKRENLLRWEYTSPIQYLIVINGSQVSIKDEKKVSKYDMDANPIFRRVNEMMIQMIQGTILDSKEYTTKYLESPVQYMVELTPVSEQTRGFLQQIHIYFDKKDINPQAIKMVEAGGDYTLIKFNKRIINSTIPNEKFVVN